MRDLIRLLIPLCVISDGVPLARSGELPYGQAKRVLEDAFSGAVDAYPEGRVEFACRVWERSEVSGKATLRTAAGSVLWLGESSRWDCRTTEDFFNVPDPPVDSEPRDEVERIVEIQRPGKLIVTGPDGPRPWAIVKPIPAEYRQEWHTQARPGDSWFHRVEQGRGEL